MPPGSRGPGLGVNIAHGSVAKCVVELVIGVRHMNQQLYQVQQLMQQNLSRSATRAGTTAGRSFGHSFASSARKTLNRVGSTLLSKGMMLGTSLFTGAVGFAGWGVKVAADMEQAEIAMQTLTMSMEKGSKLFKEVRDFAIQSPFEFPELEQSARSLLAFNVPLNDVMRVLKMLGDVASASNIPLKQLTDLYGRGKTQHRFFAQDLRELANASVDIKSSLAQSMGVGVGDISELVRKGKVTFEDIDKAFREMTSQGGRYFEGTEKKARSMGGQYNKLKDSIRAVAEEVGKGLRPAMEAVTQTLLAILPQIEEPLKHFAEMLTPDRLFTWAEHAGVAIASVIDWLELLVEMIKDAQAGWTVMLMQGSNAWTTLLEKLASSPSFTPLEAMFKEGFLQPLANQARATTNEMIGPANIMAAQRVRIGKGGKVMTGAEYAWEHFGDRAKTVKDFIAQGKEKLNEFKKPKEPQDWLTRLQYSLSKAGSFLTGPGNKALRNTMNAAGTGLAMAGMSALSKVLDPFDAKKKKVEKDILGSGFVGFEELNRKIQDSLVDQTEKKIEKNTRETKNVLKDVSSGINKMVGKMTGWSLFVP